MKIGSFTVGFASKIPGGTRFSSLEGRAELEVQLDEGEDAEAAMNAAFTIMRDVMKAQLRPAKVEQLAAAGGSSSGPYYSETYDDGR